MRSRVRSALERILLSAPRRTAIGARLILAYHNVVSSGSPPTGDRSLHLPEDQFDRQLEIVRDEADIVPLEELLNHEPALNSAQHRVVAITFDDAYASAMHRALPICSAHHAVATVFVAPGLLGSVPPWDALAVAGLWNEARREAFLWKESGQHVSKEPLQPDLPASLLISTEDQLRTAIAGSEHTVANHTFDHANLGALTTEAATAQVTRAEEWLRSRFQDRYLPVVSYPYGIAPQDPCSAVKGSSVRFGLMVSGGWVEPALHSNALGLPRWNVPSGVSDRGFRLRLRGWLTGR